MTSEDPKSSKRGSGGIRFSPKSGGIRLKSNLSEEETKTQEEKINSYIRGLDKSRRRTRLWLAVAVIVLLSILGMIHHHTVMAYAVLEELTVTQAQDEPSKIEFDHSATVGGRLRYAYGETELTGELDEGIRRQWSWSWHTDEAAIRVTVRSRWLIFPKWDEFVFDKVLRGPERESEDEETEG